jgi:transcriptional regulator with XRE-family HTH domain
MTLCTGASVTLFIPRTENHAGYMTSPVSPPLRLLGAELRAARELCGWSGDHVASRLRWSPSKISRIENARALVRPSDLEQMIRLYRIRPDAAERLRGLRDAAALGRERPGPGQDPGIIELLYWAPFVVPQALRTEHCARALMQSVRRLRRYTPSQIKGEIINDRRLQARIRREQAAGEDPLPPLRLACVLDEAVLSRRRGPTSVMTAQLDHLTAMARIPGVELRVLRLDADGPAIDSAFTILGYEEEAGDAVLLAGPTGIVDVTDDQEVTNYRFAFEDLYAASIDVEASLELVKQAADKWA